MRLSHIQHINYVSEVTNISEYDFVASVLTSWQFDVLIAYIQSHHLANGVLIVEAVPFSDTIKFRLSEEQVLCYENLFAEIYFCRYRKQPYRVGNLLQSLFCCNKEKPVVWLRPLPNISLRQLSNLVVPGRPIHFVALDEGVSSYTPQIDSYKMMYPNKAVAYRKWLVQRILNRVGAIYIRTKEEFGLFRRQGNSLVPDKEACYALRQVYNARVSHHTDTKRCILLFKDYSIVPDEKEISIVNEILAGIQSDDVDIIIKKHPQDTQSSFDEIVAAKYPNARIINSMNSGEELVAEYNPQVIIGGFSTVLISSCVMFDIPVVSFAGIYTKNRMVPPMRERQINFFIDKLGDYIDFCQSASDVCENVKRSISAE